MTRLPRDKSGLLLTAALHLALLWAALARPAAHVPGTPDQDRPALVWLRALPALPTLPAALPPAEAPPRQPAAAPRGHAAGAESAPAAIVSATPAAGSATPALQAEAAAPRAAALAAEAAPAADELLRMARQQAGSIDKQLRNGQPLPLRADSLRQEKLDQTFDKASIASRKWYHAPQIRELAVPMTSMGGDRVYEVKNAGGRYCVYHPADGSPYRIKECPREK
ncbi:hypothetical protein ASD15_05055 [Massilia sp. Root351]|jgi:hypothetical protein|uniref:hypothetical protein n=1 Tax=Massilia sp. Root351 TaxID=1736522 RepID=UPI000708D057|nr:hypothetical protein [Massilia sp. Root351]KQV91395.1 hypothetical protein ASD15_05055 [Massilia sp. Root351]